MAAIDIFSKVEIPQKEIFKHFLQTNTFMKSVSPFLRLRILLLLVRILTQVHIFH